MITARERKKLQDKLDPKLYMCYDYIFIISEDRVLATHGGNISLITFEAELLFTADIICVPQYPIGVCQYDDESAPEAELAYVDDLLIYMQDGKEGVIDYDGEIIIEALYTSVEFISEAEVELHP